MNKVNSFFLESLDLREHPLKKEKKKIRAIYFSALSYIVNEVAIQPEEKLYTSKRLQMYQDMFLSDIDSNILLTKVGLQVVKSCIGRPWRKRFRSLLICDVSLILLDENLIRKAINIISNCLSSWGKAEIGRVIAILLDKNSIEKKYLAIESLIIQYHNNKTFFSQVERRIIVTANMSAGKSTLINALIGKPLARTSQEVCTGNICYLFNKPFEDNNVHLLTQMQMLTLNATTEDLCNYEWSGPVSIASYFTQSTPQIQRLCVIDTPGVDAALYRKHTDITHAALLKEEYDLVLYVICPTNLGTDAEIRHLKWVANNLPKEKVVFVLNKLDNYKDCSDSIEESVQGLKDDLIKLGFENPVICPISAYFSYLLKLKITGQQMSDDEADEYDYLSKKFMRSSYDLSCYYNDVQISENESKEIALTKHAGIYGLEQIIYGG